MYVCIYVSLQFVLVCNLTFTYWTIIDILIGSWFVLNWELVSCLQIRDMGSNPVYTKKELVS